MVLFLQESVTCCHCGAVDLLSWKERDHLSVKRTDHSDYDQPEAPLSELGLSCFVYLLLAEEMQLSYLPAVLAHSYLLHINVPHIKVLLERYIDIILLG